MNPDLITGHLQSRLRFWWVHILDSFDENGSRPRVARNYFGLCYHVSSVCWNPIFSDGCCPCLPSQEKSIYCLVSWESLSFLSVMHSSIETKCVTPSPFLEVKAFFFLIKIEMTVSLNHSLPPLLGINLHRLPCNSASRKHFIDVNMSSNVSCVCFFFSCIRTIPSLAAPRESWLTILSWICSLECLFLFAMEFCFLSWRRCSCNLFETHTRDSISTRLPWQSDAEITLRSLLRCFSEPFRTELLSSFRDFCLFFRWNPCPSDDFFSVVKPFYFCKTFWQPLACQSNFEFCESLNVFSEEPVSNLPCILRVNEYDLLFDIERNTQQCPNTVGYDN